jgi:hypothetical protein
MTDRFLTRIKVDSPEEVQELINLGVDLGCGNPPKGCVEAILDEAQIAALKKKGWSITKGKNLDANARERRKEFSTYRRR